MVIHKSDICFVIILTDELNMLLATDAGLGIYEPLLHFQFWIGSGSLMIMPFHSHQIYVGSDKILIGVFVCIIAQI